MVLSTYWPIAYAPELTWKIVSRAPQPPAHCEGSGAAGRADEGTYEALGNNFSEKEDHMQQSIACLTAEFFIMVLMSA
eukprot:CAMPEP_0170574920 /NCGR_PEP_ID=MMETSP0224-20130122/3567_1 /TAXON_ID=285029 /ORGANISM="Togula jolla, Strain CCCM 725" /LENGTH=77 /DNA_ID=CAMNT_0010897629 /DNA_START=75 /DNA_END=305 /DNA_ORIENTATION=+